ncbi:MAG: decaprenyl-phosphate phosphoribosyltransferase [Phycisphaerae bacterium]|jgi:4-hydroxybenzoate polyprenyltransferase
MAYVRLLRPTQWSKNVFLFAGLVFGHKLMELHAVLLALLAFVCFSLLSSTVYIINDIRDRNEDRLHPRKCRRPVASGEVSVGAAGTLAAGLLVAGVGGSFALSPGLCVVGLAYLVLQMAYTFALKHVVLLDIICVGLGFVLRAVAGAVAVDVEISHWLVICTFTLCLFMGFSKRRCELITLTENNGGDAGRHRRTLASYTPDMLNHFTTLTAGIAVVTFMLYATDDRTVREFQSYYLVYTLPIVVYAIFRFAYLVEHGRVDGPTDVMVRDRPFQAALLLWTIAAILVVYRGQELKAWITQLLQQPPP